MKPLKYFLLLLAALTLPVQAEKTITLHGAVQFNDDHAYNKALLKFEELVKKYYGKPLEFVLHRNSELGLEKEYFAYMNQGISVDYAIVSPAHMSTYSKAAPFMDMPFLFRDLDHLNKVLAAGLLQPIADEVAKKADVILIGYPGGGTRNLISNTPVRTMQELKGLPMRVMGAPIQTKIFNAIGAAPTVIAYSETYNAIQSGVIKALDNEAAGMIQMRFYEVAPEISLTEHSFTIRPICFSGKTFKRLPKDLQAAILKAGKEAGDFGRKIESSENNMKLQQLAKEGRIKLHKFPERPKLLELTAPVKAAYAKEIGAEAILAKIDALK
ncbi:MAG: TRAP transporter substrate-binding protein [Burkholderiales bacterium]